MLILCHNNMKTSGKEWKTYSREPYLAHLYDSLMLKLAWKRAITIYEFQLNQRWWNNPAILGEMLQIKTHKNLNWSETFRLQEIGKPFFFIRNHFGIFSFSFIVLLFALNSCGKTLITCDVTPSHHCLDCMGMFAGLILVTFNEPLKPIIWLLPIKSGTVLVNGIGGLYF